MQYTCNASLKFVLEATRLHITMNQIPLRENPIRGF